MWIFVCSYIIGKFNIYENKLNEVMSFCEISCKLELYYSSMLSTLWETAIIIFW